MKICFLHIYMYTKVRYGINYHTADHHPCLYLSRRHEKTGFLHMRKQRRRSALRLHRKLISAFVFATWIVQSLYFLNPKFLVSSHLLWLYSPVCVGLVGDPEDRFSDVAAHLQIEQSIYFLNLKFPPSYHLDFCGCSTLVCVKTGRKDRNC